MNLDWRYIKIDGECRHLSRWEAGRDGLSVSFRPIADRHYDCHLCFKNRTDALLLSLGVNEHAIDITLYRDDISEVKTTLEAIVHDLIHAVKGE